MDEHPRRRATDWEPDDHDILIELRRDVLNLIQRVDGKMGDFQTGLSALRTETAGALTRVDERLLSIERWKTRIEGAAFAGNRALALLLAAASAIAAVLGYIAGKGHL